MAGARGYVPVRVGRRVGRRDCSRILVDFCVCSFFLFLYEYYGDRASVVFRVFIDAMKDDERRRANTRRI